MIGEEEESVDNDPQEAVSRTGNSSVHVWLQSLSLSLT